jgi:hypothetical protein
MTSTTTEQIVKEARQQEVSEPHRTRSQRAEQREGAERKEPRDHRNKGRDDDGKEQRGHYWHGSGARMRR